MDQVPPQLKPRTQTAIQLISSALDKLPTYFQDSTSNPLLPCVMLNYFAIVSCALYLLEHAVWAHSNHKATSEVDVEAFCRWVEGGDLSKVEREIESVRAGHTERAEINLKLVYGLGEMSAKL